jgi:AraC family transcriptional activator of pobA
MQPAARIHWEDAYHTVIPQINADGLLVWNFDPSLPVQVRFYTYDPRRDYRLCRHEYFEIFYLYSGAAEFRLGDRAYPLKKGDVIILNSTHFHSIAPPVGSSRHAIHGVLLYFVPDAVRGSGAAGEEIGYLAPFLRQDAGFPHVVDAETGVPARLYELMRMIAAELPARTARARLTVKTYLRMALIHLVNHFAVYQGEEDSFQRKLRSIDRLGPLFQHIDLHYSEPISLEEASRLVGMSKSHFVHFMKQVTGLSLIAYLNQFRISKAQELLAATDKSIAEISHEVGFCDQSYFGNLFRKLLKTTPREYRVRLELEGRRLAATAIISQKLPARSS